MPNHHLDDRLRLSHLSGRRRWQRWRNKRCPLHEWTIVYDGRKLPKTNCPKKNILPPPPTWRPLKTLPPKVEKAAYGALPSCNFSRRLACPLAKNRGLPCWATVPCYTFLESCRQANVMPDLTCIAATARLVVEIFAVKIWDFGAPWGYHNGVTFRPGLISTIVQNFTPMSVAVAEQIQRYEEWLTAGGKSDKTRTCVAFVDAVLRSCWGRKVPALGKLAWDIHIFTLTLSHDMWWCIWVVCSTDDSGVRWTACQDGQQCNILTAKCSSSIVTSGSLILILKRIYLLLTAV